MDYKIGALLRYAKLYKIKIWYMRRFFENVGINVGVNVGVNLNAMERKNLELILNDPALIAEKLSIEINKSIIFLKRLFH